MTEPGCRDCNQLVAEKQDLRDVLSGLRGANRQAYRQIALFLEDGLREHLIVAQAILDPDEKESAQALDDVVPDVVADEPPAEETPVE